jgi:hypothetical protein
MRLIVSRKFAKFTVGRRRRLRIASNWPWAAAIVTRAAFTRIAAIPAADCRPRSDRPTVQGPTGNRDLEASPGRRHTHQRIRHHYNSDELDGAS